ncbi:hypothetical protein [Natrinema sp. SYSU A 869]|uniref:hypothetical protein n=1 Tax=Natrinema sp. SYSU A 869 TaxID=2871694 RepID=UPI001CA43DD3|nr:hypothetical protein [Natrinema sp. SYSU A 869]
MSILDRSVLQAVETALAVAVLLVVTVMVTNVPFEYPSGPTLGGVPIDPELVVPGAFGVIVLVNGAMDGLDIWSSIVGAIGAITVLLASGSLYTLYTSNPGMFAGGLFTLATGVPLSLLILGRRAVDMVAYQRRNTISDAR